MSSQVSNLLSGGGIRLGQDDWKAGSILVQPNVNSYAKNITLQYRQEQTLYESSSTTSGAYVLPASTCALANFECNIPNVDDKLLWVEDLYVSGIMITANTYLYGQGNKSTVTFGGTLTINDKSYSMNMTASSYETTSNTSQSVSCMFNPNNMQFVSALNTGSCSDFLIRSAKIYKISFTLTAVTVYCNSNYKLSSITAKTPLITYNRAIYKE